MRRLASAAVVAAIWAGCPTSPDSAENLPPTAPDVAIFPAEPVATDWLDAVILGESVDPEGAAVTYRYRWALGGVPAAFLDDLTAVWPEETASGHRWEVAVTALDPDGLEGPAGTASVLVRGSPPSIRGAALGPLGATVEDTLAVEGLEWEDPDGDEPAYLYEWWKDGRRLDEDSPTLGPEAFTEGESLFVALTPVDDEFTGSPVDSNTLVIRGLDGCVALSLDGVDDHVVVGGEPLPDLDSFAIEAWVQPRSAGAIASTLTAPGAGYRGWELGVAAGRGLRLQVRDAVVLSDASIPDDGALHHVAATRNELDGSVTLFLDGEPVALGVTPDPGEGGPLLLGRRSHEEAGFLGGDLDDVRLSLVPRYRDGFEPSSYWPADPSTLAVWHWDEGEGSTSGDSAGEREATLVGAQWSTERTACGR